MTLALALAVAFAALAASWLLFRRLR